MQFFSIRNKIFLFYTFFIIILLSLIGYVLYSLFFDTLKERQINYSIELANKTQYNLEFFLSTINNTAALLSNNTAIIEELSSLQGKNKEEIDKFLTNIVSAHAYLKGIYIIGQNGKVYVSNQQIKTEDLISSFADLINDSENDGLYKDSYTYKYHSSYHARTLTYAKHIYDYKNQVDYGLLIIAIDYDFLRELISTASVTLANKMLVVDPKGETLFTFPFNSYLDEVIFKHPEILSENTLRFTDKVFGEESIIVSNTIRYSNWRIISIHPLNNILEDIRALFTTTIKMITVFFLITAFLAYGFSYSITKPILTLRKSIRQVEKGNLDVNVAVKNNDEIGELTAAFNKMVQRIDALIKTSVENEKQKAEMDFQILQAQINPHFIYNTLDSIRWMATLQNAPIVSAMASSMINLLKYNFSRKDTLVPLSEEIESVKNYAAIQKYKYGDIFDIVYRIPEEILEVKTIKFILQPIVENAIFHGFENIEHLGLIEISAHVKDDYLYILINDNGVGMTEEQLEDVINRKPSNKQYLQIGVKNVDDRIKFYCGEQAGLFLESKKNEGTLVTFKLPADIQI